MCEKLYMLVGPSEQTVVSGERQTVVSHQEMRLVKGAKNNNSSEKLMQLS